MDISRSMASDDAYDGWRNNCLINNLGLSGGSCHIIQNAHYYYYYYSRIPTLIPRDT